MSRITPMTGEYLDSEMYAILRSDWIGNDGLAGTCV
jgi:hypothetical protein